jgi:hypothetical protein
MGIGKRQDGCVQAARDTGCPVATRGHPDESPFDQFILPAIVGKGEQVIDRHRTDVGNNLAPWSQCL